MGFTENGLWCLKYNISLSACRIHRDDMDMKLLDLRTNLNMNSIRLSKKKKSVTRNTGSF